MAFSYKQTQIVKGMLERGDKQHDIAAFFGVNGGRIAEVSTGSSDYAAAPPLPKEDLPPEGPYPSPYSVLIAKNVLREATKKIAGVSDAEAKAIAITEIHNVLKELE